MDGGEFFSVEIAHAILRRCAPDHPQRFAGVAVEWHLNEVWTLIHIFQDAGFRPSFEVFGLKEKEAAFGAWRLGLVVNEEDPFLFWRIPADHVVATSVAPSLLFFWQCFEHHFGIDLRGHSFVGADEEALGERIGDIGGLIAGEDHRGVAWFTEAGGVVHVHRCGARPVALFTPNDRVEHGLFLPMKEVGAHGVRPVVVHASHEVPKAGIHVVIVPLSVQIKHS